MEKPRIKFVGTEPGFFAPQRRIPAANVPPEQSVSDNDTLRSRVQEPGQVYAQDVHCRHQGIIQSRGTEGLYQVN